MSTVFYISHPTTGKNMKVFFNKEDNRIELINRLLLNKYNDYLNSGWLNPSSEARVKKTLDNCGDFLLAWNIDGHDILGYHKQRTIKANELLLPLDCTIEDSKKMIMDNLDSTEVYIGNSWDYPKRKKEPKKSRGRKIQKLFSVKSREKMEYYKMTNKELYDSNKLEYPLLDQTELAEWKKKPAKNICNEFIWDCRVITTKAKKSVIDGDRPYVFKWLPVNTDNEFVYDNKEYVISNKLTQYDVKDDNRCLMDSIGVIEQDGVITFIDQEIEIITEHVERKCCNV